MKKVLFLISLMILLVVPSVSALTASIGNARMILRPEVNDGETVTIDKSILVKNVNNITIKATLQTDKLFSEIIELIDEEVVLEPGESQEAKFRITIKSGGSYSGKVLITFFPNDPEIEQPSVGLASNIVIIAEGDVTEWYDDLMEKVGMENQENNDPEDNPEEQNQTVSVSLGGSGSGNNYPEQENNEKGSLWIGVIIVGVFILIGLVIFFIIKTIIK